MEIVPQALPKPHPADPRSLRIAVIDLYNGEANQGMRAIRELLQRCNGRFHGVPVSIDVFETRLHGEIPDLSYDVYLSSGGPGSPYEGQDQPWEAAYFNWLDRLWNHNIQHPEARKHALFICHSFQMMCRFFDLAEITERRSQSFGIFPVHLTPEGQADSIFAGLPDPFYAADFRDWQAVQPHTERLQEMGASVLALEKDRPHIDLERAVMAIRLSPEFVGVQFHPEADPPGMRVHFYKGTRRRHITAQHGEAKFYRIVNRLEDPTYLTRTHQTIIPEFIRQALNAQRPELL